MSVRIFISFSQRDAKYVEELTTHLWSLRRAGKIEPWTFTETRPGTDWKQAVGHNLANADIVLLLLSSDYVKSEFCFAEAVRALERQQAAECVVIPIWLREFFTEDTLFESLQLIPSKPIRRLTASKRDEAWSNVVQVISREVERLLETRRKRPVAKQGRSRVSAIRFDAARFAVTFDVMVTGLRRRFTVGAEVLAEDLGIGDDEQSLMRAVRAHRDDLVSRLTRIVAAQPAGASGEIVVSRQQFLASRISDVSGVWKGHYWFEEDDGTVTEKKDRLTLHQDGDHVTGENAASRDWYTVDGIIRGEHLRGTWQSRIHDDYNGPFHLVLSPDGRALTGKWLGRSRRAGVRGGEWHLRRVGGRSTRRVP